MQKDSLNSHFVDSMSSADRPVLKHVSTARSQVSQYQSWLCMTCYIFHRPLDAITEGWLPSFYFNSDMTKRNKSLTDTFILSAPP